MKQLSNKIDFRKIYQPLEVLNLLHGIRGVNRKISLWQNLDKKKIWGEVSLVKINKYQNEIDFISKKGHLNFNSTKEIYFYHPNKFLIFKSQIVLNSNFKLTIRFPEMAISSEERQEERVKLKYYKKMGLSFSQVMSHKKRELQFRKPLIDISSLGLSFQTSVREREFFKKGDRISMRFYKEGAVGGHIHYINERIDNYMGNKSFKIGVLFERPQKIEDLVDFV